MGWLLFTAAEKEAKEDVNSLFSLWIDVIEAAVGVEQPGYVREAAANALLHSETYRQLCRARESGAASQRCRIWLAVLILIEDEDEAIRALARSFIEKYASANSVSMADEISMCRLETALARDLVDCGMDRSKNGGLGRLLHARNSMLTPLSDLRLMTDQGKAGNEKF